MRLSTFVLNRLTAFNPHCISNRQKFYSFRPVYIIDAIIVMCINVVFAVRNGVDDQLFPCELRVFRFGDEAGICAEAGALLDLAAHDLQRLLNDLQNVPLKHHALHMVAPVTRKFL